MLLIRFIAVLIVTTMLGACSGEGGSGTSISTPIPGGSSTTKLTITKTSLASNETTTVKATFLDGGKPVQGLAVNFATSSHLAIFNPLNGQATTDVTGTAIVQMTTTNSTGVGQVIVTATVNGTPVTQIAPYYLNTPPLHLGNLTYNNSVTRGGSFVVSADILDVNGNLYTDQDVDVYFEANYGRFVADNMVGKVRSADGRATTTYFTDFTDYPGSSASAFADSFTLTLGSSTLTGNVTINPPAAVNIGFSTSLPAKIALGYNETMTFTFRVVDIEGIPAPDKLVSFVTSGSGATLQASSVTTDRFGNATAILKAGRVNVASIWVKAYLGSSADSNAPFTTSSVVTISPVAYNIFVTDPAEATSLANGQSMSITFKVTDITGNLPVPNRIVDFELLNLDGTPADITLAFINNSSGTTGADGTVTIKLQSILNAPTDSQVVIKATIDNISALSPVFMVSGVIPVEVPAP